MYLFLLTLEADRKDVTEPPQLVPAMFLLATIKQFCLGIFASLVYIISAESSFIATSLRGLTEAELSLLQ